MALLEFDISFNVRHGRHSNLDSLWMESHTAEPSDPSTLTRLEQHCELWMWVNCWSRSYPLCCTVTAAFWCRQMVKCSKLNAPLTSLLVSLIKTSPMMPCHWHLSTRSCRVCSSSRCCWIRNLRELGNGLKTIRRKTNSTRRCCWSLGTRWSWAVITVTSCVEDLEEFPLCFAGVYHLLLFNKLISSLQTQIRSVAASGMNSVDKIIYITFKYVDYNMFLFDAGLRF